MKTSRGLRATQEVKTLMVIAIIFPDFTANSSLSREVADEFFQ